MDFEIGALYTVPEHLHIREHGNQTISIQALYPWGGILFPTREHWERDPHNTWPKFTNTLVYLGFWCPPDYRRKVHWFMTDRGTTVGVPQGDKHTLSLLRKIC